MLTATHNIEKLIAARIGLRLTENLTEVLTALPDDYHTRLSANPVSAPIWQSVIDAFAIGETYFLRDQTHFDLLRHHLLPELITRRRAQNRRYLDIWSAGCATGEELYSLAITLHELLPDIDSWSIRLLGTDINERALRAARRGVYRPWSFRHTSAGFQATYFETTPEGRRIKPYIRQMVMFEQANLLEDRPTGAFDLILCRNVLLYLSQAAAEHTENWLYDSLHAGGWLLLGQSEASRLPGRWQRQPDILQRLHTEPGRLSLYQKPHGPVKQITQRPKSPTNTYDDALSALRHGQLTRAEDILAAIIAAPGSHAPAHLLLAYIYANRRDFTHARQQIDAALQANSLLADAHYLRGVLLLEEGDSAGGRSALQAALYCQRSHPLASFLLGNHYMAAGDAASANRHWHNALRALAALRPDSPISDISDTTAGQLKVLVSSSIKSETA